MSDSRIEFYVGGYAAPGARGVLQCAFDPQAERFEVLGGCDALENPSWVLPHSERPLLYAVEELPEGRLTALELVDGRWEKRASLPTKGADPCHIALTPDGRHLLVANYTGGSLAVYGLDGDGVPVAMTDFRQHRLDGTTRGNSQRQEAAHVHFSYCDGSRVYVCDLGMNRVVVYGWDAANSKLIDTGAGIAFPDGSGPRHLAFGPGGDRLYVLCELDATLHVFRADGDGWRRMQTLYTVPEDFNGFDRYAWSAAAAIHFADAHTLCASTRGHDSVAVFDVGEDGMLALRQIFSTGGSTPRDFLPCGDWLFAANQQEGRVRAFRRENGRYVPTGAYLDCERPTCLRLAGR